MLTYIPRTADLGEIAAFVIAGALLGSGAYWLKEDAQRTQSIIEGLDGSAYEACLEYNQTAELLWDEDEKLDCEARYPR